MSSTYQQEIRLARPQRVSVIATVKHWLGNRWRIIRTRQEIMHLSDHILRDIGIDPQEVRNRYEERYRIDLIAGATSRIAYGGGRKMPDIVARN